MRAPLHPARRPSRRPSAGHARSGKKQLLAGLSRAARGSDAERVEFSGSTSVLGCETVPVVNLDDPDARCAALRRLSRARAVHSHPHPPVRAAAADVATLQCWIVNDPGMKDALSFAVSQVDLNQVGRQRRCPLPRRQAISRSPHPRRYRRPSL